MYPHSDLDIDLDQPANLERNAVSHVDSDGTKKTCIGGGGINLSPGKKAIVWAEYWEYPAYGRQSQPYSLGGSIT